MLGMCTILYVIVCVCVDYIYVLLCEIVEVIFSMCVYEAVRQIWGCLLDMCCNVQQKSRQFDRIKKKKNE